MSNGIAVVLLALVLVVGCVRRSGRNSSCEWPGEPEAKKLDLGRWSDRWHVSRDAEFAEDLAIRYGDAHYGLRSGHFESQQTYAQAINRCENSIFVSIAKIHGVTLKEASDSLRSSRVGMDFGLNLPFVIFYVLASSLAVGYILRRYNLADGRTATLIMLGLGSAIFGVGGMLWGDEYSTVVEGLRIGTGHLSYREARLPWTRHSGALLLAAVALFWVIAAVRYKAAISRKAKDIGESQFQ